MERVIGEYLLELLILLQLQYQLLYLTVPVFLTPQIFIIVLMTSDVNNLKLCSLQLKNNSICLLLGFLKHASSEVWIRDKCRKPRNVHFVVVVTCNFTSDWDVKVLCICFQKQLGCKTRVNFASVGVHYFDLTKIGVRSTNEDGSIFSCNDPSASTLYSCF